MPVTISSTIVDAELAYGRNIISLFNSSGGSNRMVLQIYRAADNELIADLRQLPNNGSYAHFDIQRILQSQVSMTPNPEGTTGGTIRLFTNPDETFDYYFKVGTVNTSGIVTIDATVSGSIVDNYMVMPGRKPPTYSNGSVNWEDYSEYVPQIGYNAANNDAAIPELRQLALTDNHYEFVAYNDITDGKPSVGDFPFPTEKIYIINTYKDTDHSLQFLQRWIGGLVGPGAPSYYNGINYVRFVAYNGSTLLSDVTYSNLVSEGGGPNVGLSDSSTPQGQYNIIGCKTGVNNAAAAATATHMYVWVECQADNTFVFQEGTRISFAYRINFVEGECNDYDVVQVKWLNSLGGTDYFTFQKKNEESMNIKRNTYSKTNQDWAGANFTQYSYDRGKTVFSQKVIDKYTATTRYLSDNENQYLKNLYLSPDVKVKFGTETSNPDGEWESVVLTSNTWTERTFRKDKLFQHTIQFDIANKFNAQGG